MKRMVRFGGLIATAALTLGLLAGPAHAADREDEADFLSLLCETPALVNITLTSASGGAVVSQPACSRDTFIGR